jgi:STAM-binding protein
MARHNEETRLQQAREEKELARAMQRAEISVPDRRKDAAVAAAKAAAGHSQSVGTDYTFSRTPNGGHAQTSAPDPRRQQDDHTRHQRQQQEEMRQREEEITRKRQEKRRQEQDGIARRQYEADEAAQAVRHNIAVNNSGLTVDNTPSSLSSTPSMSYSTSTANSSLASTPSSSFYATTPTQAAFTPGLQAPMAVISRPPSFIGQFDEAPSMMPLESPTRYEGDSTDSESVTTNKTHDWRRKPKPLIDNSRTPTRAPARRCVPSTCILTRINLIILYDIVVDVTQRVAHRILLQSQRLRPHP